jgi:hypothetical protein
MKIERILHLTLMKKWFDEILAGNKKIEYREIKPYWTKRLLDEIGKPREYDFIYFRNGYSRNCRKMKVEFKGLRIGKEYEILLGDIVNVGR